jgi:DNA repair exonuclease SbcCD ATPase subunit
MLIFKKLKYKNFLSVGDNEIEIDLNSISSTLIVGHNGSGKSLMLDALSFVLFGKPHRNITKPQLINSINGKGCRVEIEFSVGVSEYKIIRAMKPNSFEIWCNGSMVNQESHSRDYQKLLETNILKLNHKSFHQVVVLGSGNFIPFMQLPAHQRREVIEELLDIGIFGKMNVVLKETQSKLKDTIKDTEYQIAHTKDLIVVQHKHLDKLRELNASNAAKYDEEIKDLQNQIDVLINTNTSLSTVYGENYGKTKTKRDRDNKTKASLQLYEKQINDNIKKIQIESNFYTTNDTCPTCSQNIDSHVRDGKIKECGDKSQKLQEGYVLLRESMTNASNSLAEAEAELQRLLKLNNEVQSNQALVLKFEKRVSELINLKNSSGNQKELQTVMDELESLKNTRDALSDLKSNQLEERTYNEVIGELLKDTGIKTKIIRQYLPVMNKLINNYLQMLDFFVSFELDENFSETIRSRHRDDFSYSSFSEGEKQKIDLSLLFAWRMVAKMKNSSSTNILILDEIFDASLDIESIENLLRILQDLDKETRIFVISHKQDLLEGKFQRKIEFEKKKNFTSIKSIT